MSSKKFIILFGILLALWFAWFELRPTIIKSWCSKQNRKTFANLSEQAKKLVSFDPDGRQLFETKYKSCLRMYGL